MYLFNFLTHPRPEKSLDFSIAKLSDIVSPPPSPSAVQFKYKAIWNNLFDFKLWNGEWGYPRVDFFLLVKFAGGRFVTILSIKHFKENGQFTFSNWLTYFKKFLIMAVSYTRLNFSLYPPLYRDWKGVLAFSKTQSL